MEVDTLKRKKRVPKSKESTRRTRDENIREFMKRKSEKKPASKKKTKSKGPTVDEIRKKLKPQLKVVEKIKRPFLVLKPQKQLLAQPDDELINEINATYIEESKQKGKTIRDKGDLAQKNLYFTNVKDCPREVYYKFFEPHRARDYTVKGLILFDDGNRHHVNLQRRLEDRGKARNPEGFLEIPQNGAVGYYDGLINVGVENGWRICDLLEIKSKLPYACDQISQEDYDQAQLYHFAAQFSKRLQSRKIKVRKIRIVYKDRAIQTDEVHFGWIVEPDSARQHQIMKYFNWLHDVVILQRYLPPQPYEPTSKNCAYCRFKSWCWKDYPEIIVGEADIEPVPIPDKEILESHAKRLYEIMKQEKEFQNEKKKLAPILLYYFKKTKKKVFPVNENEGIVPRQSKSVIWDTKALIKKIGLENFAEISKPESKKVTELINQKFADASLFESAKKYKPKKPYLAIAKLRNLEKEVKNADKKR